MAKRAKRPYTRSASARTAKRTTIRGAKKMGGRKGGKGKGTNC